MNFRNLIILATTREPHSTIVKDKWLEGYYTMQYMEHGGVDLAYDDAWVRMEGEWFWPAYPGPRLRFRAASGYASWFHRHIGFQGPLVQEWIAAGLWPTAAQPAPSGHDWPIIFDELITEARREDRWSQARAANLLERLLIDLAAARSAPTDTAPWLEDLLQRLGEGDDFTPDYRRLAADLGMGESTLRRRFKESAGIPLHAYVLQARMARARSLLLETDLPLHSVAERLGYSNVYFFSRQFKERFGVPPGAFRQARQL